MLIFVGFYLFAGFIIFMLYKNVSKRTFSANESLLIVLVVVMVNIITYISIPLFEVGSIVSNIAFIILLTVASYRVVKILPLCAVYALFTVIISLLAGNLAGVLVALAHIITEGNVPLRRFTVENDTVMLSIYLLLTFIIGYTISRKYGNYLQKETRTFDDSLKRKLAQYLLYGAVITLAVFFVLIFLRYVVADEAIQTLVYALALAISFTYLIFATFAFAKNTLLEVELLHKEELMHNLQAYTQRVDSVSQELQSFKHDNMNMMLGFGESIETGDWEGIREYYNDYMATFALSISVSDAIIKKLKDIHIPPLSSLLLAKFVQAKQQETEMWIEVEGIIPMPVSDIMLLDLCRIAGILVDNALEACNGVKGAEVRVLATTNNIGSILVFENTCNSPPPINEIFSKGFSTKGDSHGRGLHNVAQIIASNQHLNLETSISNGVFSQKLIISN